jgi:universal stress protein E
MSKSNLLSKILVVLESGSDDDIALTRAIRLTRKSAGQFKVFISLYKKLGNIGTSDVEDDLSAYLAQLEQKVIEKVTALGAQEAFLGVVFSWLHKPTVAIEKLLSSDNFQLIIKSPHQQSDFMKLFKTGLDKYFVSECTTSLWLVKPKVWDDSVEVLACVDIGDDSADNLQMNNKVLATSDYLSSVLAAEMHVVDCYYGEIGTMRIDYNNKRGFKVEQSLKEQHLEKLKNYVEKYSLSDDVVHLETGGPDGAIPHTAHRLSAEVAVIGNNEDTNIVDKLLGDTALELSKAMPCDILIVKPDQLYRE